MTNEEQKQSWEDRYDKMTEKNEFYGIPYSQDWHEKPIKQFISQEIQKAYQKGIVDAVKELDELGYNKEAEKKAREEERERIIKGIDNLERHRCFHTSAYLVSISQLLKIINQTNE